VTRDIGDVSFGGTQPGDSPVCGGVIVGQHRDGRIVALDATTLRDAWSYRPKTGERYAIESACTRHVIAFRISVEGTDTYDLVALDLATGAPRWQRARGGEVWGGGDHVYIEDGGKLEAVDDVSGATVFRRDAIGAFRVVADDAHVIMTSGDAVIHDLDARTGDEIAAIKVKSAVRWSSELVLDGGVVYAYAGEAIAIDARTGRVLWRHDPHALDVQARRGSGGVAVTSREVLFCTVDGRLHAVNRATGSGLWEYGLGHCDPVVAAESATGLAAYVNEAASNTTDVLHPAARRDEAFVVSGVVRLGDEPAKNARVTVLGTTVSADANGRYEVKASAQGRIMAIATADAEADKNCDEGAFGESDPVALTGAGRYVIDVRVSQNCSCGL
jgi:outer membrane protein assembly factor BamB